MLMRTSTFLLHAAAAATLLAASALGCGEDKSGSGGSGGLTTTTSSATGTTAPPVPTPDAAFSVNTEQPDGLTCPVTAGAATLGLVTASMRTMTVNGGDGGAGIVCSVLGSSSFEVDASANAGAIGVQISIPAITSAATAASPAAGTVSLAVPTAGNVTELTGSCSFYFVPSTPEAVTAGEVWVAFTCPGLTNPVTMDTCAVTESYALFENCVSGS